MTPGRSRNTHRKRVAMSRGAPTRRSTVLALAITLVMTGLMIPIVGGCGTDNPAEGTTTTTASVVTTPSVAASPATSASSETTASSNPASDPAGEVGATVSVSSTNGAYPKDGTPDWSRIESVVAFRTSSMGVASLFVVIATYDIGADSISSYRDVPAPPEGEGRVDLVLTRTTGGQDEPRLIVGTYDFGVGQGQAELTGEAGIYVPGGSKVSFQQSELENDVRVTALSDTRISGTFHVKDKWSEISGTFTAPVK
jgi:hypothetical protein